MSVNVFLDTNVLVYAFSMDEDEKRGASLNLIQSNNCYTSVQALYEFCNVCQRKWKFEREAIEDAIHQIIRGCVICGVNTKTLLYALRLHDRYGYSHYDCVMLSSALEYNCERIFTEDMSSGQMIESKLMIVNPFID
jgi:predicted nucleic acid-binding protein